MSKKYDMRHGGPYDRGSADSYYQRGYDPHFYTGATYSTPRAAHAQMTTEELAAYDAGYNENEAARNFKDWR